MRVSASLAALLLACSFAAFARDIVVGQVVDYAGRYAEASRDFVGGAKTCFDLVNSRGGVHGNRIRLQTVDGGSTRESLQAKIRALLDETAADVLFGFVGDQAVDIVSGERELKGGEIALVGPLAGRAAASEGVFFIRPSYDAEATQILRYLRTFQIARFAVVKAADEYGSGVGASVERQLTAQKFSLEGSITLGNGKVVEDADADAVLRSHPQAVILAADSVAAAEFVKRYRPRDPGAMMVGLSTLNHQVMFELLGPQLANGVMITQVVPHPAAGTSPLTREYIAALRKFRDEPPSHVSLEGFIAAKVLVEALRSAGAAPTRRSILQALRKAGRLDLDGFAVNLTREGRDTGSAVEMTMIRRNGALLH
jgi:branched-chain amino acid transport system substrate-binding protein